MTKIAEYPRPPKIVMDESAPTQESVQEFYKFVEPKTSGPGRHGGIADAFLLYDALREDRGDFDLPQEVVQRLSRRQPPLKQAWQAVIRRTKDEALQKLARLSRQKSDDVKALNRIKVCVQAGRAALRQRVYDHLFAWLLK